MSLMERCESKSVPDLTEEEINYRLHTLLDRLEESEQRAVLAFFEKVLDAFERGSWKLGKA